MEKQELVVKKDLSIENEKKFDDYLTEIQKKYGSLVVSKETEKDTKKVIAELRKLKKEIKQNCHLVDGYSISEKRNLNKWKNKS